MTQPVYLDSYKLYAYVSSGWMDLTPYWIESLTATWGMTDNDPLDLVAATGELEFTLDNTQGIEFLPDAPSALAGWKKGTKIKLVCTYAGQDYVRQLSYIDKVRPGKGVNGYKKISVTAVDWMEYASKFPIVNPSIN